MADININEVYEELKYLGALPETSRLIKDYLALREEIASLKKSVERWMQYHETAKVERDACLDELKKKDAEIARLRALVRELTNVLEAINTKMDFDPSIGFKWTICDEEFESLHTGALVDRAREVVAK